VTTQLDGSPELKLVGAVLGALLPAVLGELFKDRTKPGVALLVALAAIALTYISLTAAAYVTEKPAVFPLPPGAPSPTGTVTDGDGGLAIEITPARLECSAEGCGEQVTITNAGDLPLQIDDIVVEGDGAASFHPVGACANQTLPESGDSCSFDVEYTPPTDGGTTMARLVIHQNLPLYPSYVPLVGADGELGGCLVPNVTGQAYDAAEQALLAECSSLITVEEVESDQPTGTVLSTDPPGGARIGIGGEVVVRVSDGSGQRMQPTIPDITGYPAEEALATLAAHGFTSVQVVDAAGDPADPEGATAVGTSPSAGSAVAADDPILLKVQIEGA
jgi:hypothetical protein